MNYVSPEKSISVKRLCVIEKAQPNHYPSNVKLVEIDKHIIIKPDTLDTLGKNTISTTHYDLLVLCAAVEIADRFFERPKQSWPREIYLSIPVSVPNHWKSPVVMRALQKTLDNLTGDHWIFEFTQAQKIPMLQHGLPLESSSSKIIAYSDGLDSRAVAALTSVLSDILSVRVSGYADERKKGDSPYMRLPFKVSTLKEGKFRESSFRTRGFKFAAITAIAAQLAGTRSIVVPESGQGALGPVLHSPSKVYRDYRNHPVFFRMMEEFIGALLGCTVHYEQPRLWHTKGQTLRSFLNLPEKTPADLTSTRSCWQTRENANILGKRGHCGLCAACLLRRASLHAAEVLEPLDDTYVFSDLSRSSIRESISPDAGKVDFKQMVEFGIAGVAHFQFLAEIVQWPEAKLKPYALEIARAVNEPYNSTLENLRLLFAAHADEWQNFLNAQGTDSFLRNWIKVRT